MRILIFGDSITQSSSDVNGGWVGLLRNSYIKKCLEDNGVDPPSIYNLGVSADSSNDLLLRFVNEIVARASEDILIVVAIGVNDSRTIAGADYSNTKRYEQNLEKILRQSKQYTNKTLFIGLTSCDEALSNPVAWDDVGFTNDRVKEFNTTLKNFCQSNKVPFVEILEAFSEASQKTNLFTDGLHPNSAGHQLIADLVKPELDKLIND